MRPAPFIPAVRILAILGLCVASAGAEVPDEGDCPGSGGRSGESAGEDATPTLIREGIALEYSDLPALRKLIPAEVWSHRSAFFSAGMLMQIGPCHRRYPVPRHFSAATQRYADRAELDADGNLRGYVAGTPFPPESIAADDPQAGTKWAWNLEYRNREAGPRGRFRITDMPSRTGGIQVYTGEFFQLRTSHRADLVDSAFAQPGSEGMLWISGGRFDTPSDARHLAWRQLRSLEADRRYSDPDDTFVYTPAMRKVRRAATAWVDGLYTPSYRVGDTASGGSIATGSGGYAPTGAVSLSSALSHAATEHLAVGFNDLSIRPNAYRWRLRGMREVLAPINGIRAGYPENPIRNYGTSGLAVGSDRWEVRYAAVIEGRTLNREQGFDSLIAYVDHQTQLPLYLITRRSGGLIVDIGIPVHRFSGEAVDYPHRPGADRTLVFDPVAAVYYRAANGGSGWRRESYDLKSTAPSRSELREMTTTDTLLRGN
ncbi:MAG: DUF1329 domain-containing protein [Deltaproteobacteria bacterium]|nr:DUF1329 domain-containing protein [Deltaproteobacteria bacterium]